MFYYGRRKTKIPFVYMWYVKRLDVYFFKGYTLSYNGAMRKAVKHVKDISKV